MNSRFWFGASALALVAAIVATGPAGALQAGAAAQPSATPSAPPVGPSQLRDFQLTPRGAQGPQPVGPPASGGAPFTPAPLPGAQRPAQPGPTATPAPAATNRTPAAPTAPRPNGQPAAPTARGPATGQAAQPAAPQAGAPTGTLPAGTLPDAGAIAPDSGATPTPVSSPAPARAPATPATPESSGLAGGPPLWVYFAVLVGLGLLGYGYRLRRQAVERRLLALPAPGKAASERAVGAEPAAPRPPRPAPVPRAWVDIEIIPERAHASADESAIEFELVVKNSGGSTVQNLKLQARMFPSTPEQDSEIGAFFRMRPGGEQRTLDAPPIEPGEELRITARVDLPGERMKALQVEQRLLFIPLVAINAFYDWGTARSGQSSRSFILGREKTEPGDKMAPFRLDLGPRVYRTIGRRPYKLERRV